MGENPDFGFPLYAKDCKVKDGEIKVLELPEDIEITGKVIAQDTSVENNRCLLIDSKPMEVYEYFLKEHKEGRMDAYLVDDNKELIQLGQQIRIEGYYLMSEPDEFNSFVENTYENSEKTREMFLRLKEYYKKLKVERHRSGLN